jgi:putative ABC transport system permease protein
MNHVFSPLVRDVRYALRALRKTPAFSGGALVTVAMTVAATTAIFSVVHAVLLRQLPYRDAERVFWIWSDQPGRDRTPFNVPDFIDYRDGTRSLSGLAGVFASSANLSDEAAAERLQGLRATGNLFDVLGARARIGRLLQATDQQPEAAPVVVLSESLWRRRFAGAEEIVGRAIRLNGEDHTVVGVLAAGFALPIRDVEFVVPFAPDRDPRRGARNSVNFIIGVGRLADGTSPEQASGELNAIAKRLQQRFPVENARKRGVRLVPALDGIVGPFRTALVTLFAAVGAVLLIACANLANLLLTRAASRRRDLAVQIALGSSRLNVVRQVLVEALLIGLAGGAVGVLIAQWSVAGLVAFAPPALPRAGEIRVDGTVLLFSFLVSSLTAVLFGVIPAMTSARVDVRESLQAGGRGTTAGGQRMRGALVSAEVALSLVLLVVVTLLAKSFANVLSVAPGFDPAPVLSARLTLPAQRFNTREAILVFQQTLESRLSLLPAVTHTGAITLLPLSSSLARVPFTVEGRTIERERVPYAQYRTVTAGYFAAAQIPIKRGRTFLERDTAQTPAVAVVSEELARLWLDGLEPIGARLLVNDNDTGPRPIEVIGVVGNVRQLALEGEPTLDLYLTYSQVHPDNVATAAANMFWIVRTMGEPAALANALTQEVRRVDAEVAASQVRPMESYLADAVAPRRFSLWLMAAFAAAAMVLAVTGIYAVITYSVSQRARELAIRIALGASRSAIIRVVMGPGIRLIVIGLTAGVAMALGAARLLSTMLFGVAGTDPATFAQVGVFVTIAALIACAIPAARVRRFVGGVQSGQ